MRSFSAVPETASDLRQGACLSVADRYLPLMAHAASAVPTEAEASARFWARKIRHLRWKINVGWWCEYVLPTAFISATLFTVVVLFGRREGWPEQYFQYAAVAATLLPLLAAAALSARRFISLSAARTRLEYTLALESRLSSAAAGVGAWPSRTAWKSGGWRWNWKRLFGVPILCAALVTAAFVIQIPAVVRTLPPPVAKPPALAAVEEWLAKLEKAPEIDPVSLEQLKEEAAELAQQDPAGWYSEPSLEAADHLKGRLDAGLRSLEQSATKLESVLSEASSGSLTESRAEGLNRELQSALGAVQGNVPGMNRELSGQLGALDPSKLRNLSPDQLKQWKERLEEMRTAAGTGSGGEKEGAADGNSGSEDGEGKEGDGDGEKAGDRGGRGGRSPGDGATPLSFEKSPAYLNSKKSEGMENEDFSTATIGDQVGVSAGQHEVDHSVPDRAASGGAAAAGGEGGDAVWLQQGVVPEERRRIREFFK